MTWQLSSPWKPRKLDELGFVGRGRSRHRPRNDPILYGGKVPFFQTGDVKDAELYLYRHSQTYNDMGLAQSKLWQPGTLCITIAANIAETAILAISGCFPDSVVGFVPNEEKSDAKFIKYYIDTIKLGMQGVSRGTTQDNLSLDKLLSFDFLAPGVEEQRRLASILSAYDDLIENNTRRIAILEEMARALYQEWFVDFRFPGHEHVPLVDSPLGPIPEGWEVKGLYEVADVTYGFPFKSKLFNSDGNGAAVIRIRDIRSDKASAHSPEPAPDKCVVKNGDILIGMDGEFHMGRWAGGQAVLNQRVARVRPRVGMNLLHLFYAIEAPIKHLERTIVGTTVAHLSAQDLKHTKIVIPKSNIHATIGKIFTPIHEAVLNLKLKNSNLRATRDLLLPKLISGEIDISALSEEPIPEAAD